MHAGLVLGFGTWFPRRWVVTRSVRQVRFRACQLGVPALWGSLGRRQGPGNGWATVAMGIGWAGGRWQADVPLEAGAQVPSGF